MGPVEDNLLNEEGIFKGADFSAGVYTVKDVNGDVLVLTDYTFTGQIREDLDRTSEEIVEFVINVVALEGTFEPTIPDTVTTDIIQMLGYYDILVVDPAGLREYWVYGIVDINKAVSVITP